MKNAFKNQLEMNENSWKINGLLHRGAHDENVFVFFWCVRLGRDGVVSNPLERERERPGRNGPQADVGSVGVQCFLSTAVQVKHRKQRKMGVYRT